MGLACLDGEILDASEARLPVTDEGLLRGDGVFEVARLYGGRPFALDDHLARMARSAANLRLPIDTDAVRADVERLAGRAGAVDAKVRMLVTRGGHRIALVEPLPARRASIALGLVEYAPMRTLDGVKSLSYAANMLASRLAAEQGADEALFCTPHGRLLEGPTQSFFCVLDGTLVTPPLTEHILASITRARILSVVDVEERPVRRDEIDRMEEAFVASTTVEVLAVHAIDGCELPAPGPRTSEAAQALREHIEASLG
jgi:branched-chain amino acid aminotransferase